MRNEKEKEVDVRKKSQKIFICQERKYQLFSLLLQQQASSHEVSERKAGGTGNRA